MSGKENTNEDNIEVKEVLEETVESKPVEGNQTADIKVSDVEELVSEDEYHAEMKKNARDYFIIGVLSGILVMLIGLTGIFKNELHLAFFATKGDQVVTQEVQTKLQVINGILGEDFLYDIDPMYLEEMMIRGYIAGLGDTYAGYYNVDETVELRQATSGEYSGIGAVLSQNMATMTITVSNVFLNSPAEDKNLKPGDIILTVDGEDISEQDLTTVVSKIKGEEGTDVRITIDRDGKELNKKLTRRVVENPTIECELLANNIGYIEITEFDTVTLNQFQIALDRLEDEGMESLIIDVRNNPGGSLKTVTDMLDILLPKGLLVYTEDKDGNRNEISATGKKEFDKPLVVLINGYSASAAEIFAGAIKDYGLGTLIGTNTYGKGVVQNLVDLGDGTSLKYTTSEYFTASGNTINNVGIEPNIAVSMDNAKPNTDEQLKEAKKLLKNK